MKARLAGSLGAASVVAYFFLKIGSALTLLAASTAWLQVAEFAVFTQLLILAALFNLAAVGGAQNGLIRVVAAAEHEGDISRTHGAAIAIWLMMFIVAGGLAFVLQGHLSILLVGDKRAANAAFTVVLLSLASGPGQIVTSILTGRHRPSASLAAQSVGLLTSTIGALWFLRQGEAQGAAVAFAAGPLLTLLAALPPYFTERLPIPSLHLLPAEIRRLFSYSAATVAVAAFGAAVLFGLRAVYRDTFGLEALSFWLAASRISDTTTQFLGLAILQLFLPRYSSVRVEGEARRMVLVAWAGGVAAMSAGLLVFAAASEYWIRLILSPAFIPATGGILIYLSGDVFRVWAAVAMHVQLARGRPLMFAGIEIASLSIMAVVTLAGISAGMPLSPMLGYLTAYAGAAMCISVWFSRGQLAMPPRYEGSREPRNSSS